jgi:hypothetical protein
MDTTARKANLDTISVGQSLSTTVSSSLYVGACTPMRESENTPSPRLRFSGLLTENGDRRVQLHRA